MESPQPSSWMSRNGPVLRDVVAALGLLYLFLLSIHLMGMAFKMFGKGFAEGLIENCSSPVAGLFVGVLTTSVVQSSSMTTSLTVGLVASGVLPLVFAVPVIMGANIGTTITNLLVAFGFVTRREDFRRAFSGAVVHDFFNLLAVLVLFPVEVLLHPIQHAAERLTVVFEQAGGVKFTSPLKAIIDPPAHALKHLLTDTLHLGDAVAGIVILAICLTCLFLSLGFLVKVLRRLIVNRAERVVHRYLFRNAVTGFVLGMCLTVLVQSSSVTTSMIVPLVAAGVVSLQQCYPYTLGANIGTTCTALLASMATVSSSEHGAVGLTAALCHLLFNIFGIAIFYPLRALPIGLAQWLAGVAARSRGLAVLFVIVIFFGLPLLMVAAMRLFS